PRVGADGGDQIVAQALRQIRRAPRALASMQPRLGTVAADRRKLQGLEQGVEIADRPAADQRQRAIRQFEQARQRPAQAVRHVDFEGRRTEIDQRAVDIEQKGRLGGIEGGKGGDCVFPHRASTSTSPSTPATTLNSRSNTLPSLRAMARYSPSARMTRGKAPI